MKLVKKIPFLMKLTYLPLWNKIKNALLKKQLITKINFSYQNIKLLKFLLKNNFISGFEKRGSSQARQDIDSPNWQESPSQQYQNHTSMEHFIKKEHI